ncbi:ATP-binding cassette sub-family C member 10-like isoform X9 [Dreissena polymorpha]|nr:ATP-binding cassette sub-family C member 10-like isoform X9 [Dreissena polymorpha]
MSSEPWHQFCGHGENFSTWKNGDFSHCFEQIVVVCPSYIILAITSSFYIASSQSSFRGVYKYLSLPWYVIIRLVLTILLTFTAVFIPIGTKYLNKFEVSYSDIVTTCTVSFSWLLHCFYVYRLKYLDWSSWRGAKPMIVMMILPCVSTAAQLHTNILQRLNKSPLQNSVEEYSVYVSTFLLLCYFLTLVPGSERVIVEENDVYYRAINESFEARSPLLSQPGTNYRSISQTREATKVAEENVNCLSWLTFHWVQHILAKGARRSLQGASDVFMLPVRLSTGLLFMKFTTILTGKCDRKLSNKLNPSLSSNISLSSNSVSTVPDVAFSRQHAPRTVPLEHGESKIEHGESKITLFKALNKAFGWEYYPLGILKFLADILGVLGPILLNRLVTYMESNTEPESHGYWYAVGLFAATLLGSVCSTQFDYYCSVIGLKIRAAIITTIYRKSLSVSNVSAGKFSSGQITNLMSTDTDRIVNFCPSFLTFWSTPFLIAFGVYLLHQQVGVSCLAGLAFAILLIPINRWLAIKIGQLSKAMMEQKDNRVKVMNEILFGIRVVKFYAWEDHFESKIRRLRDAELKSLTGMKYLDAMCVFLSATTPVVISILTFTTYSLLGNQLTAAKVFTSLSLFLMLISLLNAFPWFLNGLMEAWVSMQRVQQFVALPDLDLELYYSSSEVLPDDCVLQIQDAEFNWKVAAESGHRGHSSSAGVHKENSEVHVNNMEIEISQEELGETTFSLVDLNFRVLKGQFVGVIGKVGAGKSSLLSCLLAEMHRVRGHIRVNGLDLGFAIATQEPWIQHATVRDNILFGSPFNSVKYEKVIDACALTEDLQILPAGDMTEVGENGVTLSGGQKSRVALARAVYQDKDVILLDDPLAAVDAHVAQHLYQRCIMGLLGGRTRILCTHHTKFLSKADMIIVLDNGRIVKTGLPSEILASIDLSVDTKRPHSSKVATESRDLQVPALTEVGGALVGEETKETGSVRFGVYMTYLRAMGICLAEAVLRSLLLMQASRNVNDWWLSYWVSHSVLPGQNVSHSGAHRISSNSSNMSSLVTAGDNVMYYLTIYGCLAGANSVFTLLRAFLFAYGGVCAARTIHTRLLSNILKAPITFFDTTPIGRIVNRFSSDIFSIDDSLPFIMNIFLAQICGILGTIIFITCYGLQWFAVLLLPLAVLYYKIQKYYRESSRELKRISSVTLSPIYAHFSESITGMTTIRAMREQERFQLENISHLETNQRAQFTSQAVVSWLVFRLQMLGVAMVTGIAFIAVLEHHFRTVNPGLVGLAILYALSVTNLLGDVLNSFAETEKKMVSVERAQQYIEDVPNERMEGSLLPPPYWPNQGSVVFRGVCMKYRHNLADALNKVSFEVEPAEKVGVVGRTGSGKSSIFLALFRMVEIYKGNIFVDEIDLIHLDLKDIRSRFAIIPQDPFLFSGSVRENLDPTCVHSDSELWSVLDKCHLRRVVEKLGGLGADAGERGKHFSVGQRQLVCLARALLTKAKILCIDEATASVDMDTDMLIQQTIRSEFQMSTVLTIAHRINTIMDSDRVLIMADAHVAEFAAPGRLLMNQETLFYKLVNGQ